MGNNNRRRAKLAKRRPQHNKNKDIAHKVSFSFADAVPTLTVQKIDSKTSQQVADVANLPVVRGACAWLIRMIVYIDTARRARARQSREGVALWCASARVAFATCCVHGD